MSDVTVWFNPRCTKCRGAEELLAAHGVDRELVHYLDEPPPREEIERVLSLVGSDDPRAIMRTREPAYVELGLGNASRDELLDAMAKHPELIERPIVVRGDRAVVARPPELLLQLLDETS